MERLCTEDWTPPAPVSPGLVEASVPDAQGSVTVSGSAGTLNPDDSVIILNDDSGLSVLATVASGDGSFQQRIRAALGERLILIVRDRNDNQTRLVVEAFVRRYSLTREVIAAVMGLQAAPCMPRTASRCMCRTGRCSTAPS